MSTRCSTQIVTKLRMRIQSFCRRSCLQIEFLTFYSHLAPACTYHAAAANRERPSVEGTCICSLRWRVWQHDSRVSVTQECLIYYVCLLLQNPMNSVLYLSNVHYAVQSISTLRRYPPHRLVLERNHAVVWVVCESV